MFTIAEAQAPQQYSGYWIQRSTLVDTAGRLAIAVYRPDEPEVPLFSEPAPVLHNAGLILPGFLESMNHPDVASAATAFAKDAGMTTVTFDPRGTHASADASQATWELSLRQMRTDVLSLAEQLAPKDQLIIGGKSMGGSMALLAASELYKRGQVNPTHVFALKTPHEATAHRLFSKCRERAQKGRPLFACDISGQLIRKPISVTAEDFEDYAAQANMDRLLDDIAPYPLQTLVMASTQDNEIALGTIKALAAQHGVTFRSATGDHSGLCPAAGAQNAAAIIEWYADLL